MKRMGMRHRDRADDRPGAGNGFQGGAAQADAPTAAVNRRVGRHHDDGGEREAADPRIAAPTAAASPPGVESVTRAGRKGEQQNRGRQQKKGKEEGEKKKSGRDPSQPAEKGEQQNRGRQQKQKGRDPAELSERERRFVDAYCGVAKGNAQEAARLAGYKHAPRAAELLRRDRVKAEVKKRSEASGLTAEMVMGRVALIATADMADFAPLIGCRSASAARKALEELRRSGKTQAIRRLVPSRWGLGVELYPADAALALAGKHLGLFRDQVEVTVNASQIDGAAQRRLLADPQACELAATLDARLALPSPDSPAQPEKGPGVPQDEPIDVEWSNLPGEPDKSA